MRSSRSKLPTLFFGLFLIATGIALMWWNERTAIRVSGGLAYAEHSVVEVPNAQPISSDEGKLVHVRGVAIAHDPLQDKQLKLAFHNQIAVQREVEMYQWDERIKGEGEFSYTKNWFFVANDSSHFENPTGHTNPPMPFASHLFVAADAQLGGFKLDSKIVQQSAFPLTQTPAAPAGWKTAGGALYHGDPQAPKIGDLRVTYTSLPSGTVLTVLAAQRHDGFVPFVFLSGYTVFDCEVGNQKAAAILSRDRAAESRSSWTTLQFGALILLFGFASVLAASRNLTWWLSHGGKPSIVALALVSADLTISTALAVVALTSFAARPLYGSAYSIGALVGFYWFWRWVHAGREVAAAVDSPA